MTTEQRQPELPTAYDPTEAEKRWYPIWEKAGYFEPDPNASGTPYCIVIPPPNVTGSLHMGHALTVTIEDILIRWRRMLGHKTMWVPGTDHAGIATQMVVERDLAKTEKKSRHDLGREKFLERVWQWKGTYGNRIAEQLRVMGCSLAWTHEHFTMDDDLSRAVREVFVRLWDEKLIYRAERLVNWCPRCLTALSDLEVEYDEEHQGELWSFAYPLEKGAGEIVVATTRPETMLGDTAVAVHPDDPRYKKMVGQYVRHPLLGYRIPIVADPVLVDMNFGTGAVKVTPAHDFNDFETGKRHHLDLFNILDEHAKITQTPEAPSTIAAQINTSAWRDFAGLDRFVARAQVKEKILALGLDRGRKDHKMALGKCQRCDTVLEPTLSVQWWVRTKPLAEPALAAVKSGATRIVPDTWTKTYYHWMENIQDWCVSRQLWWGHRIPAWYCTDCDQPRGKVDNLRFLPGARPLVSAAPPQECPRCHGKNLVQDSDVLDTWFSSALWPFSTLGWPTETQELKTFYPNAVMETGFDILFFWVARMMMMGCKFMGQPPFPVIYLHAMVRDKHGDKMSKTKGNVIDPLHLVHGCSTSEISPQFKDEYPDGFPAFGADALRFTLAALSQSGRDIKLSVERIAGYRAFANKLWNAARFVLMKLDGFTGVVSSAPSQPLAADTFILSRLARTVEDVNAALEAFRFADAANSLYSFVWNEFCDWYIELVKPRLYGEDLTSKNAAQNTLIFVLDRTLRMLHPFMPFITEEIWQKLPIERPAVSIMKSSFPKEMKQFTNEEVEQTYLRLQNIVVGLRTIRAEKLIAPSKPIEATVLLQDANELEAMRQHSSEIIALARLSHLQLEFKTSTAHAMEAAFANAPHQYAKQAAVWGDVFVPLAGLIDVQAEKVKLERSLEKAQKEMERIAAKFNDARFVERAPQAVITKDKARVQELEQLIRDQKLQLEQLRSV